MLRLTRSFSKEQKELTAVLMKDGYVEPPAVIVRFECGEYDIYSARRLLAGIRVICQCPRCCRIHWVDFCPSPRQKAWLEKVIKNGVGHSLAQEGGQRWSS